jgi:hypothetical protein
VNRVKRLNLDQAVRQLLVQWHTQLLTTPNNRPYLIIVAAGDHSIHLMNHWHSTPRLHDLYVFPHTIHRMRTHAHYTCIRSPPPAHPSVRVMMVW